MGLPAFAYVMALLGAAACLSCGSTEGPVDYAAPAQVGVIRIVPAEDIEDESRWGSALELALEAEYWDTIVNSDHEHFPAWKTKVERYTVLNEAADERLQLLLTAGAVFQMTLAFTPDGLDSLVLVNNLSGVISGARRVHDSLPDHVPAQVFYNNNLAMRGLLLGPRDEGIAHLEDLLREPGSEGRAAAAFTYGMIQDEAAVRYAIGLNEACDTFVCDWTSEIAPFKPIGQMLMLAELHAVLGEFDEMGDVLDRAESLAVERDWPFIERIDALRAELPTRVYTDGEEAGVGLLRWPLPVYADEVNCSGCHVGALPGRSGITPPVPYENHDRVTPVPAAPDLSHLLPQP